MITTPQIERACPAQVDPSRFFSLLKWLDGRPLLDVMEPYRQQILSEALFTFRPDGSPLYKRVLTGRGKKNSKTTDLVLACLYKCLAWQAAGHKGNQCFLVASDLGQANDALDLTKKLIACNPVLADELLVRANVIARKDGLGFIEILPSGDALGLHGKTYLFYGHSELHTQRDYRVLEALELDRTRPDATQWFESYASVSPTAGMPLNDLLKQHAAQSDPRLFVSWYAGTVEEANPSLNGPLGPTMADIEDAQRALPSWIFRRLYQNLPGQPDHAAFNAEVVQACVVPGRTVLPPQAGTTYSAFTDMSGGGSDDSTLAIGHVHNGIAVVDLLMDQGPRPKGQTFSPAQTVLKFAGVLKEYGCHRVIGDNYAGTWPADAFSTQDITYIRADKNRSQLYAQLEPKLNSGAVALLDSPKLIGQLIGLVRKGDKIDHPTGEHDDHSNVVAGCVALLQSQGAPWFFRSAGVTIGASAPEPAIEEVEDDTPSLVERASTAIGQGVQAITKTLTQATSKVAAGVTLVAESLMPRTPKAVAAPPEPYPLQSGRRRTLAEIEILSEGCRSYDETQRLQKEYERRAKHRAPSAFEEMVKRTGLHWPGENHPAPIDDLNATLESVRRKFAMWR